MIIDRTKRISAAGLKIVLGIPFTRVTTTGLINGTNKEHTLPVSNRPIYPKSGKGIIPLPADVVVEALKGTTYTTKTVASLKTLTDTTSGLSVYGIVELQTALAALDADSVVVSGAEECWARIAQDITPSIKTDSEDLKEVGTNDVMTIPGGRTRTVKYELKITVDTLKLIRKIMYEEKTDQTGVATGYTLYTERDVPIPIYAYIPVVYDGEEVERYVLTNVTIDPDLPTVKAGDATASINVNMNIPDAIDLLAADEA
jgi:hypothetical protein